MKKGTLRKNQYDKKNLMIIGMFLIGLLIGTITANTLDQLEKMELSKYVSDTITNMNNVAIYYGDYLFESFTSQIKIVLIIWVAGFFAYGFYVIYATVMIKGFLYGFTVAFLTGQFSLTGFFFGFLSYIPQNLIYLPVIYILAKVSIDNSLKATSGRKGQNFSKNVLFEYTVLLVVSLAFFGLGALVETYLTPGIVSSFIGRF
ncbi:stage II sporulation protein M [Vallitalea okinawensis]|uniref:stage II sporulation protein M n=1 Tax=Vallitalea okinawensis TaxID=2078660 RepID=UPI00130075D3|nr:stage II sporulation protein M [Vallitalea okinawensis]